MCTLRYHLAISIVAPVIVFVCPLAFVTGIINQADETAGQDIPPCVAILEPVRPGEQSSRIIAESCFENWGEYVEFLSGGAVEAPDDITKEEAYELLEGYVENLTTEHDNR